MTGSYRTKSKQVDDSVTNYLYNTWFRVRIVVRKIINTRMISYLSRYTMM